MSAVFLKVLNMSIAAGWLILAVIVLRFLLKKAPGWIACILWAIVAVKLICPFSIESVWSLIPSAETIHPDIIYASEPTIHSGVDVLNHVVNPVITKAFTPDPLVSANPLQIWIPAAACAWVLGIIVLLVYACISYFRLHQKVSASIPIGDSVWIGDEVQTPFILGIIKPGIYLPSDMKEPQMQHVLAHEQAHLKRYDHWWKPLGFLLLAVHWFNPLVWVAYILLCRDIELACDEYVVREMNLEDKKAYSKALLACSIPHRMTAVCPLAFGEVGVKERVKNVLNYKKPTFWMLIAAVVICIIVAICFLTNPKKHAAMEWAQTLSLKDIQGIELVVRPQSPDKQFRLFSKEEWPEVVDLIHQSRGKYVAEPEPLEGGSQFFYLQTADGLLHEIGNIGNRYLVIDGDYYDAGYEWLSTWDEDYAAGNAPLPESYTDAGFPMRMLTLDDVIELSKKSDDLTWESFDRYLYTEAGSGLYIRIYKIDALFSLWIGGGTPTGKPMYIRLRTNTDLEAYIDIQEAQPEDVNNFIQKHLEGYRDAAVTKAVMDWNRGKYLEGNIPVESHKIFATEAGSQAEEDTTRIDTLTVYALVLYQEYNYTSDMEEPEVVSGGHVPTAITFNIDKSGNYTLAEYWEPRDGGYYASDIREKFPKGAADEAMDTQKYIDRQKQECVEKVKAVVDNIGFIDENIESWQEIICTSSGNLDSSPEAYILAHPNEYQQLIDSEDMTLQYIFSQFLKGGQTDLRGKVMEVVMHELLGDEAIAMAKYYPKAWMLIQMDYRKAE